MTLPTMTRKEVDQLLSTLQTTTHNGEMLKLAADLAAMQARAEAAEKEVKRWKDAAKNLASSVETDRDAALFDRAVAGGKVKLAEARAEAAEKERDEALRERDEAEKELDFWKEEWRQSALEAKP